MSCCVLLQNFINSFMIELSKISLFHYIGQFTDEEKLIVHSVFPVELSRNHGIFVWIDWVKQWLKITFYF